VLTIHIDCGFTTRYSTCGWRNSHKTGVGGS